MSDGIVNKRNIEALAESAKQERDRADAMQQRVAKLESMVAMFQADLNTMRSQVAILLTRGSSTGPTARGRS